jgi:DNA-binding response OmpR family regulator
MKNKITIIEDDADLRSLMELALKTAGFDVVSFSNGNSISGAEGNPDMYIIDINLGGISGLDVCREIKNRSLAQRNAPVVVIIISANPDLRTLAMEACADDTLAKPFNSKDLIKKITQYLPSPKF